MSGKRSDQKIGGNQPALTFLGTGAGSPSRERNVTAALLERGDGALWLIDCGEGTQHQIMRSSLRMARIERILITHLHGDHVFGLPGLLASLAVHQRRSPVTVFGPPGLRGFLEAAFAISDFTAPYPLVIEEIPVSGGMLPARAGIQVQAYPLRHRLPSFAYNIRFPLLPGHLDARLARKLGVEPGPAMGRLAAGQSVLVASGAEVLPQQVLGPPRPGLHLVWCGDCTGDSAHPPEARGCDVLVHEATFDDTRRERAAQWGHSTAAEAAAVAADLGAGRLILTHISARFTTPPEGEQHPLLVEARALLPDRPVDLASDHWRTELIASPAR